MHHAGLIVEAGKVSGAVGGSAAYGTGIPLARIPALPELRQQIFVLRQHPFPSERFGVTGAAGDTQGRDVVL